ncbi:MAG: PAS domain S-box protein [Haloferacaceae archaeon]
MGEPLNHRRGRRRSAGCGSCDGATVRVLHVDEPDAAQTTAAMLERARDRFDVVTASTPAAGLDRLAAASFDCVVSGYDTPGVDGISFYRALCDRGFELPFVLFTGAGSESVASEAFAAGVADYVRKESGSDQYATLAARVERAVDEHRSRAALAASQERLSLFVEQSPLGVLEYDDEFEIVAANPAAEEILGYAESELVGRSWTSLASEESRDHVEQVVDALARGAGGSYSHDEVVRADGSPIVCEWHNHVVTDDAGETVGAFSQFRDITDRKRRIEERNRRTERLEQTRDRLQAVRNRYRALIHSFPDGAVFMFDRGLTYTVAGGQGLAEVGLTTDDFLGQTPFDLFADAVAEETAEYYRRALEGTEITYEQRLESGWWRVLVIPVRDDEGRVVSGLAVTRDVTEEKRRIEKLNRQKERLEEFASLVSHDLRNPLNVAEGRLELAREERDDHLAAVARAHDRMRRLIDDLLTLARTEREVESTDPQSLAVVAKAAWRNVDTGKAALEADADREILADRGRLQRLFENLFRNAVEHGGETVTVAVGVLPDDEGFFVADDGPGVPPEDRETVFETGYSTADEGTGFGLQIVEQAAVAHGWRVELTESDAGGARFEFRGVTFDDG